MIRIGITGGIGSGKSEVTDRLKESGYPVIDADEVAREAAVPGEPSMLRLREKIGDTIFLEDGALDRPALAKLMFNDPVVIQTVNEIFHDDIHRRIEVKTCEIGAKGEKILFLSLPLLFESGFDWKTDEIWLVTANEDLRTERVKQRDGLSETDVRARIRNQMPEKEKRERADVIIENNGTLSELYAQVGELTAELTRRFSIIQ